MSKMSMLQADLENSAMSRSNSRAASSYGHVLNKSFSPREPVAYKPTYRYSVRDAVSGMLDSGMSIDLAVWLYYKILVVLQYWDYDDDNLPVKQICVKGLHLYHLLP